MRSETRPHTERAFYRLVYTPQIFELTSKLFRYLNRGIYSRVARSVAWSYAITQHGVRQIVQSNLSLLDPRCSSPSAAVRVFTNFGSTIADYIAIGNMAPEKAEALCCERGGLEYLEEARKAGRGAILVTGHFGFFEFGALLLGRMGYPVTVLTLPEPSPELTRWRADFRRRWGAQTIEIGRDAFSSLQIVQALGEARFAAMLADRPMGDHTTLLELPNGRIRYSLSPALIAYMTDCPIIPVAVRRLADGSYSMTAKRCVWPRRLAGSRDECVRAATRSTGALLFEEISRSPEQWYQFVPVGV